MTHLADYRAGMFHHAARALPGQLLFHDAIEAHALWTRVVHGVPGLIALCLMPNHVHLLHARDVKIPLGRALAAYVRWHHARRGTRGTLIERGGDPREIHGRDKEQRQIRYVHLNPCRARLVTDPLCWPFSTHLDALGLAAPAARPAVSDPLGFHRYVSADGTVSTHGTDLPVAPVDLVSLDQVLTATAAVTRTPSDLLCARRGPARALLLASARALTPASSRQIADRFGVSRSTVLRIRPQVDPAVAALTADPRIQDWEAAVARACRPRWSA